MSDLFELAIGLHKQAKEKTKGGKLAGTAAGVASLVGGAKLASKGGEMSALTGGRKGVVRSGIGAGLFYGSYHIGKKVKQSLEKKADEKKKDPLRPGVVAGLATLASGGALAQKGGNQQVRAMKSLNGNLKRVQKGVPTSKAKGYYENGKYVKGPTPNLRANRLQAVQSKASRLGIKGMKNAVRGGAMVLASPVVGALVGKAHRMMTEKKDK